MEENKKLVRCFVAIEISRDAINGIEEIQRLIKKKNLFYGKFTEPENLHLTLKFLGEIPEEKIEEIRYKLRDIKLDKFKVSIGDMGLFSKKTLKILWIKLLGKSLWDLQEKVDWASQSFDFKKEEKFMAHITLARIKKVIKQKEFLEYVKNLKHRELIFEVSEFVLKKSELKSEGPVYSDLERYALV